MNYKEFQREEEEGLLDGLPELWDAISEAGDGEVWANLKKEDWKKARELFDLSFLADHDERLLEWVSEWAEKNAVEMLTPALRERCVKLSDLLRELKK